MAGTRQNKEVFKQGIAKAVKAIEAGAIKKATEIAEDLVSTAVHAYGEHDANLTGNLLNSIAGGVYLRGRLETIVTAGEATYAPEATSTYVRVGDGGFVKYRTDEVVEHVMQYKGGKLLFQPVNPNETGVESATSFLMSIRPSRFLEVVICAAAPYAEFLQNKRKLDVLTTAYEEAQGSKGKFKAMRIIL